MSSKYGEVEEVEGLWERVKAALRRDWEQTRGDLGLPGPYLGQNAGDTLRQMQGVEEIPAGDEPTLHESDLADAELEAIKVGFIARKERPQDAWSDELASELAAQRSPLRLDYDHWKAAVAFGWRGGGTGL